MTNLNQRILLDAVVAVAPLAEQARIVTRVDELTRKAARRQNPSMSAHMGCPAVPTRGIAPVRASTACPARGPKAMR